MTQSRYEIENPHPNCFSGPNYKIEINCIKSEILNHWNLNLTAKDDEFGPKNTNFWHAQELPSSTWFQTTFLILPINKVYYSF